MQCRSFNVADDALHMLLISPYLDWSHKATFSLLLISTIITMLLHILQRSKIVRLTKFVPTNVWTRWLDFKLSRNNYHKSLTLKTFLWFVYLPTQWAKIVNKCQSAGSTKWVIFKATINDSEVAFKTPKKGQRFELLLDHFQKSKNSHKLTKQMRNF